MILPILRRLARGRRKPWRTRTNEPRGRCSRAGHDRVGAVRPWNGRHSNGGSRRDKKKPMGKRRTLERKIAVLDAPSNLGLRPPRPGAEPGCKRLAGVLRARGIVARLGAAGVAPTTTMLGVTRLAIPDLMVELEGTAVA